MKELRHRTGWSRQRSWKLWQGQVGVGRGTTKRLHERLRPPTEELLQIDPVSGRPRQSPRDRPSIAQKEDP
jgi:hypothetical protein